MVGITEASATLTILKTASDLAKMMLGAKIDQETRAKVYELQQLILDAQGSAIEARQQYATLDEEVRSLKAEAASREEWLRQAKRYTLKRFPAGAVVYDFRTRKPKASPCIAHVHSVSSSGIALFSS